MSEKWVAKLNYAGVNQLLRCDELKKVINQHAGNMARNLGRGYSYSNGYGAKDGRVRAYIHADTVKAKLENLESNTILNALGNEE